MAAPAGGQPPALPACLRRGGPAGPGPGAGILAGAGQGGGRRHGGGGQERAAMNIAEQPGPLFGTQASIAALQAELAETNRGQVALTMELEQRVDERTAELRAAHEELKATNSSLMQMTLELDDRIAKRTAELVVANKELLFQNEEKEKRAVELIIANKELLFQNEEKEKRAAEMRRMVTVVRESEKRVREINALQELLLSPNPIEQKLKLITDAVVRILGAN